MRERLLTFLALSAVGLVGVFAVAKPHAELRGGNELCTELTRELVISVERGLIDRSEADQISKRCFRLYGGK